MTKAVSLSFGVVLGLCLAQSVSFAQSSATGSAVSEAVRRQGDTILLRQKLEDARAAVTRGDLNVAVREYEEAWELAGRVGPSVDAEAMDAAEGLVALRIQLADAALKSGDLLEGQKQVDRALKVKPLDERALALKAQLDRYLADTEGKRPSEEALALIPIAKEERVKLGTMVQDAKLLIELGKLDEAEKKLNAVVAVDPTTPGAYYYLSLLKERRSHIASGFREAESKNKLLEINKAWEPELKGKALPQPNLYARTNLVFTGRGRQLILAKLDRMRLDNQAYDGLPLGEVVRQLYDESRKRDPEKKGINFIINPNSDPVLSGPPQIDPTTGLAIPQAPPEAIDVAGIQIKLNPGLSDVRFADILEAVVKTADRPIKYSVEDYAVVFSLRGQEPQRLETRRFKVDPNTFYQGLESVSSVPFGDIQTSQGGGGQGGGSSGGQGGQGGQGSQTLSVPRVSVAGGSQNQGGGGGGGGGGQTGQGGIRFTTTTNSMEEVSVAVRTYFQTLGVDLTAPKALFWNDRKGEMLVRATADELDIIENAIQVLNVAPPMVNIKAKFVEINQQDNKAIGFDWYLGNFSMGSGGKVVGTAGTQPSLNGVPSANNPSGVFPTPAIPPSASDSLLTSGIRNVYGSDKGTIPALASFTGILTDPQFKVVIRALEQREGADLLTAPEVTTLSGRQAQVQIVDIRTIVTGVNLNQTAAGTGTGTAVGVGTGQGGGGGVAPSSNYNTQPLPFGPILDVIPYVSADGYTVQMTIIPTITEFVGYDDPGGFVPQAQAVSGGGAIGQPLSAQLPLPRFRVRQVTTHAIVWDGQTVVLGGLIGEDVSRLKDKVPILGDLPWVGKLFRSESSTTRKKNLVIFVTPTIIDPAGNRKNSEDEMPFAASTFPPQTPAETR